MIDSQVALFRADLRAAVDQEPALWTERLGEPRRPRSRTYRRALPAAPGGVQLSEDAADVLEQARTARRTALRAEVDVLRAAVAWAELHPGADLAGDPDHGEERPDEVAGEGAPSVAEFCVAELALSLGLSTESGRLLVGDAVELAHRLPTVWARVVAGEVPAFKARRIAQRTRPVNAAAAAYVDRHVASRAGTAGHRLLDRLVDAALLAHDHHRLAEVHRDAAEHRHLRLFLDHPRHDGTVDLSGRLDHADAAELERAIADLARQLLDAGSTDGADVRRAQALGMLARGEHALPLPHDLTTDASQEEWDDPAAELERPEQPKVARRRRIVLHVHLHESALDGSATAPAVARLEQGRMPVLVETVRGWLAAPGSLTQVTVRPVIDLGGTPASDAYEVPDAIREQVVLRDRTCVFPFCAREARRCDVDHVEPFEAGGATRADNLAPACRRHHRLKTHHRGWHYRVLHPGTYLWTDPHGRQYLRDPAGTYAL